MCPPARYARAIPAARYARAIPAARYAHQQRATRAIPPARYARDEQTLSAAGLLPAGMPRDCKGARLKQAKLLPGLSVSDSRHK